MSPISKKRMRTGSMIKAEAIVARAALTLKFTAAPSIDCELGRQGRVLLFDVFKTQNDVSAYSRRPPCG